MNASPSTGIEMTIVTATTARPRRRWPPSAVTTTIAVNSARIAPREYVMQRQTNSRKKAASAASRAASRRVVSVVRRSAIGIASTITRPSAFQYSSGARRREAIAVWLKSTPRISTPGMILPATAYSAQTTATASQP